MKIQSLIVLGALAAMVSSQESDTSDSGIDFNPTISGDGSVTLGDITGCSTTQTNDETTYSCDKGSVPVDSDDTQKTVPLGGNCMCVTGTGDSSVTYKADNSGDDSDGNAAGSQSSCLSATVLFSVAGMAAYATLQ